MGAFGGTNRTCRRHFHEARRWGLVWIFGVLAACCVSGVARDVRITILCTADIHGHILPARDYEGRKNVGGLLRCASAIQSIRAQEPNVIYVDCGDLVQGAPESGITRGSMAVSALNWLQCDAWVVGNHDLDWGLEIFRQRHDAARMPLLAANMLEPDGRCTLPKRQPWVVKDVEGVRVVLVGLTTPGTPAWLTPDMRGDVVFVSSIEALRAVMPSVRALQPDILILLAHQGLPEFRDDHANELLEIAREYPEWDVIFGGHTHKVVEGTRIGRTLYVQAGYFANWLARVDLTFDNVTRTLKDRVASVIEIGTNWIECAALREHLGRDLDTAEKKLGHVLGHCERDISAVSDGDEASDMQDLLARAVMWKTGADAALIGEYGEEGLEAGPVTVADIWRAIPYENTIGLISLTPPELRMVLRENMRWSGSRHALVLRGLRWNTGDGKETLRWPNGHPVHGRRRLRVAVSSYALASGGRRYECLPELARRPECRLRMTGIDTRSAVIEYVRKHKRIGGACQPTNLSAATSCKSTAHEQRDQL